MLTLQILSPNPALNSFSTSTSFSFAAGSDFEVVVRMVDAATKLRYIPIVGATASLLLINADLTTISKTPTLAFPNDDRSILTFSVTATESELLISQNLKVVLVEGLKTSIALLNNGLSKSSGGCC